MTRESFNIRPVGAALLALFFWMSGVHAQSSETDTSSDGQDSSDFVFRPTVGLGTGMLTFYGDVGKNHRFYHPTVSRVGYELRISNPLTPWLDLGFHVMRGKMGANERFPERNLNFESRITTGGFNLTYNFDHLLPPDRNVEPFVSVGLESFEFLSKTDLYDENGNRYHYWSDGTIRDRPEDASDADQAKILTRDYTYETDLRELNLDGFGDYPERSWAVPVAVGAELHLSDRVDMRLSTRMYFTFTDYIDNVTHESLGARQGDAMNDKYLYSAVSISYDLQVTPFEEEKKPSKEEGKPLRRFDLDGADEDEDGVVDLLDQCPHSPVTASIDSNGCPIDDDGDVVPNYTDAQLNTPDTLIRRVDTSGDPLTDEELKHRYLVYMDSTGKYTEPKDTIYSNSSSDSIGRRQFRVAQSEYKEKRYMVKVGESTKGITADKRDRLLSIPGVRTIEKGDTSIYVVGEFEELPQAVRRKFELEAKGVGGKVVSQRGSGEIQKEEVTYAKAGKEEGQEGSAGAEDGGNIVFRVQLGAFSTELSRDIFSDVPELLVLHGDDGLVRYVTGSFTSMKNAAEHKVEMYLQGYEDAFITAFKNGERIPLSEAGAQVTGKEDLQKVQEGTVNKELVGFSIQLGAFKKNIPTDKLKRYMELGDVRSMRDDNRVKYLYGDFKSLKKAKEALQKVKEKGIEGAFITGTFKNRIISKEEAKSLLKESD